MAWMFWMAGVATSLVALAVVFVWLEARRAQQARKAREITHRAPPLKLPEPWASQFAFVARLREASDRQSISVTDK
jgi:hypothetical protein